MADPVFAPKNFWSEAFSWQGAATGRVLPTTLTFGLFATLIYLLYVYKYPNLSIEVGPHEVAGVLMSLLLIVRTNAGYDRWWEARKLWGGIVNQSRNLTVAGLTHGPADPDWRDAFVRWTAAFAWASKARLRGDGAMAELKALLGSKEAAALQLTEHAPLRVAYRLEEMLRAACARPDGMDRFAFLQAERERALLLDHLGGCERIRNTPLASAYSITISRFILIYLATLPFALLHKFESEWLTPVVTILVAYPVLMLDQLGMELEQPFATRSLNHLPLDDICRTIEKNLLSLARETKNGVHSEARSANGTSDTGS